VDPLPSTDFVFFSLAAMAEAAAGSSGAAP